MTDYDEEADQGKNNYKIGGPSYDVEGPAIVQKLCEALQTIGTGDVSPAMLIMLR
jgi:hypothetical protein